MILLLGGTSETGPIAERIARLGVDVLVSTATDIPLGTGDGERIRRRSGRLSAEGLARLIETEGAAVVVDATHPFAEEASREARQAASAAGIPYLVFSRPSIDCDYERLTIADDHEEAARIAFSFGVTVLAATGSKDIAVYAARARQAGPRLVARVLDHPASIESCRAAGLSDEDIIAGRGPFSVEENLEHIERAGAGVIVTKDSGAAGGVGEKIEAARRAGISAVMVKRPRREGGNVHETIDGLAAALREVLNGAGRYSSHE
ncbi:MAG: precorrin-6A reductase [Candidatus Nitrospinota bacterium M3_3B_026]